MINSNTSSCDSIFALAYRCRASRFVLATRFQLLCCPLPRLYRRTAAGLPDCRTAGQRAKLVGNFAAGLPLTHSASSAPSLAPRDFSCWLAQSPTMLRTLRASSALASRGLTQQLTPALGVRYIGATGPGDQWGQPATGGTKFLGTPANYMEVRPYACFSAAPNLCSVS